jgi:hypothetical protein
MMLTELWWFVATVVAIVAIYFIWVRKPGSKDRQQEPTAGSLNPRS